MELLLCTCSSAEHQIIFSTDVEDDGEPIVYAQVHLIKHGFWRRLKAGIKYIFGYKCRYGAWDEVILGPEHRASLQGIADHLTYHQ